MSRQRKHSGPTIHRMSTQPQAPEPVEVEYAGTEPAEEAEEISRRLRHLAYHSWAENLEHLAKLRHEVDAHTAEVVGLAREAGAPWALIGDLLGVTAQGAQQKYGRALPV